MKVIKSGIEKEVVLLKHFKINEDEYIIYQDSNIVSLGQIINNQINIPNSEKMDIVKKIIGNLISSNYNDIINTQNNCIILRNDIDTNLEEKSVQHINFTDVQLANLKNEKLVKTNNIQNTNKKSNILPILIIIIFVLLAGSVFVFKDKIFKTSSGDPKQTEKKENTKENDTKKEDINNNINKKDNLTPEQAINEAYNYMINNDYDSFINLMPSVMQDYTKKGISREDFTKKIENLTNDLGVDVQVISNVTPQKMDEQWIKENTKFLQEEVGLESNIKMTECYEFKGTITLKGSKGEKVLTDKDFSETWYCKVNDDWGFIFG